MKTIIQSTVLAFFLASCSHSTKPVSQASAPDGSSSPAPLESLKAPEAASLSRDAIYQRLVPISIEPNKSIKFKESEKEFSLSLPVEKPAGDQKGEWHGSHVQVFYKTPEKVDQIAVITMTCNAENDIPHQKELQERFHKIVNQVSDKVLGSAFEFQKDRYLKELGPNWAKHSQVTVKEPHPVAQKMRIDRGLYKCDGRSGVGFRFDFIL